MCGLCEDAGLLDTLRRGGMVDGPALRDLLDRLAPGPCAAALPEAAPAQPGQDTPAARPGCEAPPLSRG
ncbi:hypothetical protein [Oceanicella sp. SM1341]|uniref:hypothetical protein n=1 Tax=Oceanicella sp. SM1341 TaxID=1548889 RepID=UPI0013009F7B|nr:hypothetical protein [Oceanicella sp. SM1341]